MPTAQRRQPGATKAERRRQRAAAAMEAARRRERRRRMLIGAGIAAGVLAVGRARRAARPSMMSTSRRTPLKRRPSGPPAYPSGG
jgi:hypothetical protein